MRTAPGRFGPTRYIASPRSVIVCRVIRTQIQLTKEQAAALKQLSRARGVSMATLIREAVDRVVEKPDLDARWSRALAVVGRFPSQGGSVADDHDRHLEEAYLD